MGDGTSGWGDPLDLARDEILAGRPLLCVGEAVVLLHAIREAARVAGRYADLRVLWWDEPGDEEVVDGSTRRRPVDPGTEGRGADVLPGLTPSLDWVPVIDGAEIEAPGAILLAADGWVHKTRRDRVREIFGRAVDAARRAGRPVPHVLIPECADSPDGMRFLPGPGWTPVRGPDATLWYLDRGPGADGGGRWPAAVEAFGAANRPEVRGGVATVSDGDRMVAVAFEDGPAGSRRCLRAYEIGRSGWATGVEYDVRVTTDRVLADLALDVFRSGTHAILHGGARYGLGPPAQVAAREYVLALATSGGRLLEAVSGFADIEAVRAASQAADQRAALEAALRDPSARDFVLSWRSLADGLLVPGVRAALDGGARTLPAMAAACGLPVAAMRRLVGRDSLPFRSAPYPDRRAGHAPSTGPFLKAIGHDRLPEAGNQREWLSFCGCCAFLHDITRRAGIEDPDPGLLAGLLLRVGARDWHERRNRILRSGAATGDIADMVAGTARWLAWLGGRQASPSKAFEALAQGRSLVALQAASVAWHADVGLHGPAASGEASWPVPFGSVDLGDGWLAMALGTQADLSAEGGHGRDPDGMAGLGHCVGGYGPGCRSGESVIVSLRHDDGRGVRRVSTAELRRSGSRAVPGRLEWKVASWGGWYWLAQHRGRANADPPPEAWERLQRLREILASGEPGGVSGDTDEGPEPGKVDSAGWASSVAPAYQRLFPPRWRDADPDAFLAAAAMGSLGDAATPSSRAA